MATLFLGSGPFGLSALRRLAELDPQLTVGTVPDARAGRGGKTAPTPIKACAQELGLPCYERATLRKAGGASLLDATGADLVIVADFRLLLPVSFLEAPPHRCFNLHGSILPRWRGAAPIQRAILAGDSELGVTIYRMVKALDAGPVLEARGVPGAANLGAIAAEAALAEAAAELLVDWYPRLRSGDLPLVEQDDDRATLAPKLEKSEGWVDWSSSAEAIAAHVRAFEAWPRSFTDLVLEGQAPSRVFICEAIPGEAGPPNVPGTVRPPVDSGIPVACGPKGSDTLLVTRLQRAGKKPLDWTEFVRGCRLAPPARFEAPAR